MSEKKVEWISHRGYCQEGELENTKGAFDAAVKLGFFHLETDLRMSSDKHLLLSHDMNLFRLGADKEAVFYKKRKELEKISLKT